jgi:peptidoglycan/xylan/chitin deacetylase (PgdA/CDA1 family)
MTSHRPRSRAHAVSAVLERLRFLAPRRWHGLVAFNYHRIGDGAGSPFDHDLWSASAEELDRQVAFLREHFDVVHPKDVPELQRRGRGRHVLITFDDGYRDNYELAFPVLRRHGVPAAFFVATGFLDAPRVPWWDEIAWMVRRSTRAGLPACAYLPDPVDLGADRERAIPYLLRIYKRLPDDRTGAYIDWLADGTGSGRCHDDASTMWMSWEMVRELHAAGMAVGGHTVNHPVLARLDRAGQESEITTCARRIREQLGETMRWFAYPVGGLDAFNEHTRAALSAAGVELAFSYYGGYRRYDDWDPLDVRRIAVETYIDGDYFRTVARWPALMAPLPGQRWPGRVRELMRAWVGS